MLDQARIVGGVSALFLLIAVAQWVSLFRRGEPGQGKGAAALNIGRVLSASRMVLISAGLGMVAVVLAISGWFTV